MACRMRIGVIGVGRMGRVHATSLAEVGGVDVLITDVDVDRAAEVGRELGVDVAAGLEELIGGSDAIVVAAATDAHADLIHAAADAALPTFCEKPISLDLESTAAVVAHVEKSGIPFMMGFQRRFDPGYLAAHNLVRDGSIGTVYVVRMAGHDPAPPHEAYIATSGGIFRDFSVHDFDAVRFVTGQEVVSVYADGGVVEFPVFTKYGDVDTAVAVLRLSGGSLGILSATRHDPLGYDIRMELIGSRDCVAVGWDDRTPLRSVEPGGGPAPSSPYRDFQDRFREAYRAEMAHFVELAAGREKSPCTAQDALEALRIAVACDRSRAERRPVSLEEIG
ncbi:MAG TPA: Gfo/Idh/MocA family oxidoreductase [Actinomycetota bacterium]|nr:Gfo/Idh/MocA family oxidoreductase [Actinomycetota bacterium]